MMNRRSFVISGAVGAGTLALSLVGVTALRSRPAGAAVPTGPAPGASAMADMPGMAGMSGMGATLPNATAHEFDFRGHAVKLTENAEAGMLVIDGRHPIHLDRPDVGQYHTHLLPFNLYTDPKLLVKDVLYASASHLFII